MGEFVQTKVLPPVMKFVNTRGVRAIKDGMMFTMPLIMVGAVYLLLFQMPIEAIANAVTASGIVPYLAQGYTSTFQMTGLIAAMGIAYTYAKNDGYEPMSCAFIGMSLFLIFIPSYVGVSIDPETGALAAVDTATAAEGVIVSGGLNKTWLAGQGMVAGIIAGLLSGVGYNWFRKKDIKISMPEGVPDGVAAAFTALIPGAVILTCGVVIYAICDKAMGVTPVELIYRFLQVPLQGLTDSLGGVIGYCLLVPFFWWFGVHGATLVGSVMSPIAQANMLENQAIYEADGFVNGTNGGHILTEQFLNFTARTGSGWTFGLVIFMMFFAKSQQYKTLGKLGLGCGLFNINEPILFGTPIVMNPKMIIPFMLAPLCSGLLLYFGISLGFVPYFTGVTAPWTTPPLIHGLLLGGVPLAICEVIMVAVSFFIYLPFIKSMDNEAYALEQGQGGEEAAA